ncbi:MAG: phage integrase N-terminal SAM-like domain-containing protein [Cytophagales bacterium]|nr:phage integrase N-terminal SAM-like domain-containing protein [Cytophagales bacterium]
MNESFKDYLRSKGFTRKSIDSRMMIFKQFRKWLDLENMEAEQVTYNDLLLFMKHCQQKGRKQKIIQHYMVVVKQFYDHLLQEEMIADNPASDIEVRGVKRKILYHLLEPHELHSLYNRYDDESLIGNRNKVILGLSVYQGLQTEALAKLEIDHVLLREGKIDVPGGVRMNGRIMQLEAHQVMDMYDYILRVRPEILKMNPKRKSQSKTETNKLFIGEGGNCYSFSNLMTQLMRKVRKLNPTVKNAKQIRASVITKWLKTHDLREVQYLAGHRYISSAESYLQNDMEELMEEINQYHPLG